MFCLLANCAWAFPPGFIVAVTQSGVVSSGYTDNFSGTLAAWTQLAPFDTLQIVSGGVVGTSGGGSAMYYSSVSSNNHYSEVFIGETMCTSDIVGCGPIVRGATGASKNAYAFYRDGAGTAYVCKWVNGAWASVSPSLSISFTGGKVLRLEASGTTITAKAGGTTVWTGTDTSLSTGKPGIFSNSNGSASALADNWAGDNL